MILNEWKIGQKPRRVNAPEEMINKVKNYWKIQVR